MQDYNPFRLRQMAQVLMANPNPPAPRSTMAKLLSEPTPRLPVAQNPISQKPGVPATNPKIMAKLLAGDSPNKARVGLYNQMAANALSPQSRGNPLAELARPFEAYFAKSGMEKVEAEKQAAEQARSEAIQKATVAFQNGDFETGQQIAAQIPDMQTAIMASLLKGEDPETWGAPVEALDAQGNPTFVRPGSKGNVQPVEGFSPVPKQPKLPNSVEEYKYAVNNGNFQGTYADWKSSNRPTTNLNFNDKGFDELSKLDAQTVADVGSGVRSLRTMLPDLERMAAASDKFGTGAAGGVKLWAGQWADALGIEGIDNLSEGELIRSIQSRLAPQMRATGSGASSDRDVEMFLNSLPNLMQTPEGNKKIVENYRKILDRKQQEERIMRNHYRQNGGTLDGVYQVIDEQLGPSIFGEDDQAFTVQQPELPQYQPQQMPQGHFEMGEDGIETWVPGGSQNPQQRNERNQPKF